MKRLATSISGIDKLSEDVEETLKSFSTVNYVHLKTKNDLIRTLNNCDIFWFRLNHNLDRNLLKNIRCKYLLCAVTGLDHIDVQACDEFGIHVISLKGENEFLKDVRATAEHTISLMFTLMRKSKKAFEHVEQGNWNRDLFLGEELFQKKLGVLGFGRLGRIVAKYAFAFGMEVYYYDVEPINSTNEYIKCNSLESLLSSIDVLTIHIPYNKQTHFLIDKEKLVHLKHTAYVINTSRGGVLNEADVLSFIKEDKLAGYATDVLYGEPNIKDSPLIKYASQCENIVISPHIGGYTIESIRKTEKFILEKLITLINE